MQTSTRLEAVRSIDVVTIDGEQHWRLTAPGQRAIVCRRHRTDAAPPFVLTEGLAFDLYDDGVWRYTPPTRPATAFWWLLVVSMVLGCAALRWTALLIPAALTLAVACVWEANHR